MLYQVANGFNQIKSNYYFGDVAQLARAPVLQTEGCGFEAHHAPQ